MGSRNAGGRKTRMPVRASSNSDSRSAPEIAEEEGVANHLISAQLDSDERMELREELDTAAVHHMEQAMSSNVPPDVGRRHVVRAAELFDRVAALDPEDWHAWWNLGRVRQLLGDHEEAYRAFVATDRLEPDRTEVCLEMCNESMMLGKGAEAIVAARRACATDPEDAGLVATLALAYLLDGQVEKAAATIRQASQQDLDNAFTRRVRQLTDDVEA